MDCIQNTLDSLNWWFTRTKKRLKEAHLGRYHLTQLPQSLSSEKYNRTLKKRNNIRVGMGFSPYRHKREAELRVILLFSFFVALRTKP